MSNVKQLKDASGTAFSPKTSIDALISTGGGKFLTTKDIDGVIKVVDTEVSLGDVFQTVTVGQTTTGEPGTNAEVVNSGTGANAVLDFTIPRGEDGQDAVNPFKGLFVTTSDPNIPVTGQSGDYIFIADANPATTIDLYYWNTNKTPSAGWDDTGFDIDPGSLAEFATGQKVSLLSIIDDPALGSSTNILGGLAAAKLRQKTEQIKTEDIAIGAVTPAETSFMTSVNLMNPADASENKYLKGTTGVEENDNNYNTTGFIKVKPNTDYYISPVRTYVWLDVNKTYISGTDTNQASGQVITSPANAAYFRACALKGSATSPWFKLIVSQSSTSVPYIPYNPTIPMGMVEGLNDAFTNLMIPTGKIEDGAVTPEKISFMRTANIFNPNAAGVETNLYLNGDTGATNLNPNCKISDYIEVSPNTDYYLSPVRTYAFFKADKTTWVGGNDSAGQVAQVVTSPAEAAYLRVCGYYHTETSNWWTMMVAQSSTILDYVPYTQGIPAQYLEQKPGNESTYGLTKITDLVKSDSDAAITSKGVYQLMTTFGRTELIQGGWNTPYDKAVSCKSIIPIEGKKLFIIRTNRPNTEGYHYCYYGSQYNIGSGNTADYINNSSVRVTGTIGVLQGNNANNTYEIINNPKGLVFSICERDSSGNLNTGLSVSDFEGYDVWLETSDTILEQAVQENLFKVDIYQRNLDRYTMLVNSCRMFSESNKDLQIGIATDIHKTSGGLNDVIAANSKFKTIDIGICLGDIVGSYYSETGDFITQYNNICKASEKPFYTVIGNHDTGYFYPVALGGSHQQMYDSFIKYMVDKGWLTSGEFSVGKPYWYHDFATQKVRLIGIYDYDCPMDFDETYWEPVTYDSSKPLVALSTAYNVDDIVNCGVFTDYSFKCKQSVTTPSTWTTSTDWKKFPSFRMGRGNVIIRQEQAQWLLDTLASTPANYTVVIAEHEPANVCTNQTSLKFANSNPAAIVLSPLMATDVIGAAVNAFINKTSLTLNVAMKGDAAYLNTDGVAYQVSKDFSATPATAKFGCYLCGHYHIDRIYKANDFSQQYHICIMCTKPADSTSDIRCIDGLGTAENSITVVSVDRNNKKIRLVKLDNNVTQDMEYRDMETIDTEQ